MNRTNVKGDPFESVQDAAFAFEAERLEIENAAEALGQRRKAHAEAGRKLAHLIANQGGSVQVLGWVFTVAADGRGIQRTRATTTPSRER